ncbi:MAG: hypothetical protein KGV59_05260, partial [Tenacibaculum sp.]|nr:hypothetical protein [Tenacibaculum sp.]
MLIAVRILVCSIIRQEDGNAQKENIVSKGNDTVEFDLLNKGKYKLLFSLNKDGKTETVKGEFTIGTDRNDIFVDYVDYKYNYAFTCNDGIQRFSVVLRDGEISDYSVYELNDDDSKGNKIVDWTTPTNVGSKKYSFDLKFSEVNNISTPRIKIVSRDKCLATSDYDIILKKEKLNVDFYSSLLTTGALDGVEVYCDRVEFMIDVEPRTSPDHLKFISNGKVYDNLKDMDQLYPLIKEDLKIVYKGKKYKVEKRGAPSGCYECTNSYVATVPKNEYDDSVRNLDVEFTFCNQKYEQKNINFYRSTTTLFSPSCSDTRIRFDWKMSDHSIEDLTGFRFVEYPSEFKPWEIYPEIFDNGSYTSKSSKKAYELLQGIQDVKIPISLLTQVYKVELIYPCETKEYSFELIKPNHYEEPVRSIQKILDHSKCEPATQRLLEFHMSHKNHLPKNPLYENHDGEYDDQGNPVVIPQGSDIIEKIEIIEAPQTYLDDKGLTVPFEIKVGDQGIDYGRDYFFMTIDVKYEGLFKAKITKKGWHYEKEKKCINEDIPASVDIISLNVPHYDKPTFVEPIIEFKNLDLDKSCGTFNVDVTAEIIKTSPNLSDYRLVLQGFNEEYDKWGFESEWDIYLRDNETGDKTISLENQAINSFPKYRLLLRNEECKTEKVLKEFEVNANLILKSFNVFVCSDNSKILKINVDGVPPFTYQIIEKDGQDVSGSNPVQDEPIFTNLEKGTYKVKVSGRCEIRDLEFSTQDNILPKVTSSYSCEQSKLNLEIEEGGYLDIEWFKDGVSTGKKGKTVEIENYDPATDKGIYTAKLKYQQEGNDSCLNEDISVDLSNISSCAPAIKLNKTAPVTPVSLGDEITYTFTVENVGDVELTNVTVNDPKLGGAVTLKKTTLAPDEVTTGEAKYTVTKADLDAGKVENTATAVGTDPKGGTVTDTSDSSAPEKGNKDNTPGEPTVVTVVKKKVTRYETTDGTKLQDPTKGKEFTMLAGAPEELEKDGVKYYKDSEKDDNDEHVIVYVKEKLTKWVDESGNPIKDELRQKDFSDDNPDTIEKDGVTYYKKETKNEEGVRTYVYTKEKVTKFVNEDNKTEELAEAEKAKDFVDGEEVLTKDGVKYYKSSTEPTIEGNEKTVYYTKEKLTKWVDEAGNPLKDELRQKDFSDDNPDTIVKDGVTYYKKETKNEEGVRTYVYTKEKVTKFVNEDNKTEELAEAEKAKDFVNGEEVLTKDGVKYYKSSTEPTVEGNEKIVYYTKEKLTKWVDEEGNPLKDDLKQKDFSDENPDTIVKDGVTYYKKETKNEEGVRTYVYTKEKVTKFVNEDNKTEELAEAEKAKDFVDGEEVLTKDGVKYYKSSTEPTIEGNEKTVYYTKEKLTKWVDEAGNPLKDELKQKDFSDENPDTLEKDGVTYYKKETKNEEGVRTYVYTKEKVTRYETEDGVKLQDPTTGKEFTMLGEAPEELEKDGVTYVKRTEKDENGDHVIVYVKKKEPVQPVAPKVTRYETEDGTKLKDSTTGKSFTMLADAPSELEKDGVTYVKTSEKDDNGEHVIVYVKKQEPVKITTEWVDEAGNPLKGQEPGKQEAGTLKGYEIVETVTDEKGNLKHIFKQIKTDYQFVDGGQAPIKDVEGEYKTHKKGEELIGTDGNKYVVVEWLAPVKGVKVIKVKPVKTTICGDGSKGKEIVIYNEFSPNGDGINDYLHIDNIDSECYNNK